MKKYKVTMEIEIDENRNTEVAIESALGEYGVYVKDIYIQEAQMIL